MVFLYIKIFFMEFEKMDSVCRKAPRLGMGYITLIARLYSSVKMILEAICKVIVKIK